MPRPNTGPHLAPGKNGIWDISFTSGGRSRRRSTGTEDLGQAQRVLGAFLLLDGRDVPHSPDDILLVRDILGDPEGPTGRSYWHEHVIPKVIRKEDAKLAIRRLTAHFGPIEIRKLVPSDVASFVKKRREGWMTGHQCSDGTIRRDLTVLVAALNHAVKAKRLPREDMPTIELPPVPEARDRWLTHEEADRLFAACLVTKAKDGRLPRVYRFVALVLGTASRKTAVLTLTRDQIDLEGGMISLNPIGRRQTKKRRPKVPVSDHLRPILERILKECEGDYLLDHPGAIRTAFENAVERGGLQGVTPHTLRHTWATWAAQDGVSMVDIAGVLGDSVQTVINNYLHHSPEHLRAAVNKVGARRAA